MVRREETAEHKRQKARSRQNEYAGRRQEERRQRGLAKLAQEPHDIVGLIDGGMTDPRRIAHVLRVLTPPKRHRNRRRA